MKNTRRLVASALTTGLLCTLWGCSTDSLSDPPAPVPQGGFPFNVNQPNLPVAPRFDPGLGAVSLGLSGIPIPNDILRDPNPGPTQGRNVVNIPAGTDPTDSLRSLRGFSTAGNILIPFDGKVDANTVNGNTILLVEGEGSRDPAGSTGSNATVACNITVLNPEGSTTGTTSTVILQPQLPLRPLTNYYCVVTAGVQSGGRPVGSPKAVTASGVVDTGLLLKSTTPLVDANGNTLIFPVSDAQARQLEPLRAAYQPFWQRAESITGLSRVSIPLVFRFGTQPLFASLASPINTTVADPPNNNPGLRSLAALDVGTTGNPAFAGNMTAGAGLNNSRTGPVPALLGANGFIPIADDSGASPVPGLTLLGSNRTVAQFFADLANPDRNIITGAVQVNGNPGAARFAGAQFNNIHRIYTGNITCGNYINPATGFFQGENLPLPGSPPFTRFGNLTVTFFLCLPSPFPFANPPTNTIPSVHRGVIYQHGIDNDKRDMFLVANELCGQGFGVVAIDLYLHGDLRTAAVPNGTGFVNPANLRATRDNIRQSISNLFYVSEAIIGGRSNVDGWPGPNAGAPPAVPPVPDLTTPQAPAPVNGPGPAFVGHSLGGIVGAPFTAVTPFSSRAVLNAMGGRLTELLLNSTTRGPVLRAGLQQLAGLTSGTDAFAQFFWIAQTVLDDVDPINYSAVTFLTQAQGGFKPNLGGALGQQSAVVLLQELTGDRTIPNSSTQDLARAYGRFPLFRHVQPVVTVVQGLASVLGPYQGPGYFQFPAGLGHEAILGLDGGNTAAVRTQIVNFLNSNPATITP